MKSPDSRQRSCSSSATLRLSSGPWCHAASIARLWPPAPRSAAGRPGAQRARPRRRRDLLRRPPGWPGRWQRLGGINDVTEQDQLPGPALTDDPGQPDGGSHIGRDSRSGSRSGPPWCLPRRCGNRRPGRAAGHRRRRGRARRRRWRSQGRGSSSKALVAARPAARVSSPRASPATIPAMPSTWSMQAENARPSPVTTRHLRVWSG